MPTPISIDFSAANDATDCLRYYFNRYVRNLVAADEELALPLLFGEAFHTARAILAKHTDNDALRAALDAANNAYAPIFEQYQLQHTENMRTPYVLRSLIHAYLAKYGEPTDLHTEIGARLDMGTYVFHGRIDYVAPMTDLITVSDVKTTGGVMWLPQARLNWQLVGYAYAVRELTSHTPQQVAIDGVVIPRPTKAIVNNPPPEWEYALALHDNLHLRTASIQPRDYIEWKRWMDHTVTVISYCMETNEWPMRAPHACSRYGKVCQYDPLCKCPSSELEERMVENLYTVKPWHPFEGE